MSSNYVDRSNILNINVGVLGHVDSGKTSLVKALSSTLSTAALDKNPQSQQRGITLDLGFSSFTLPIPDHLKEFIQEKCNNEYSLIQYTLVDCPGHSSLIRTIIGGAQIIDMIVLVIDANKGIQTQTAECIVIGEITTDKLIIVINKIDTIPESERNNKIDKVTQRIRKVFAATKFADAPIVTTAAAVGGEKAASIGSALTGNNQSGKGNTGKQNKSAPASYGVDHLVELIQRTVELPKRNFDAAFYYAVDHCFSIKGHGTVLTGTVLNGTVSINSTIEIPHLHLQRKVKSLQMFRKSVKSARQGDRVGICVTNLDAASIERTIAATPGTVPVLNSAICLVKKVRFFKFPCKSNSKFHISIGHMTVVASVVFFGVKELAELTTAKEDVDNKNLEKNGNSIESDGKASDNALPAALSATYFRGFPTIEYGKPINTNNKVRKVQMYEYQNEMVGTDGFMYGSEPVQWALIRFQQPVYCPIGSLVIGSRLDADTTHNNSGGSSNGNTSGNQHCRLAFYGPLNKAFTNITDKELKDLNIFIWKQKECEVYALTDVRRGLCHEAVVWKLVSGGGSIQPFINMLLETEDGHLGTIVSAFGADGKCRVKFSPPVKIEIGFKLKYRSQRNIYDSSKQMLQTGLEELRKKELFNRKDLIEENILLEGLDEGLNNGGLNDNQDTNDSQRIETASDFMERLAAANRRNQGIRRQKGPGKNNNNIDTIARTTYHEEGVKDVAAANTTQETSPTVTNTSQQPIVNSDAVKAINSDAIEVSKDSPTVPSATIIKNELPSECVGKQLRNGTLDSLKIELPSVDGQTTPLFEQAIISGAFRMEENVRLFIGCIVIGPSGEKGEITGPFGKLGKCKVKFSQGCAGPLQSAVWVFT